MPKFERARELRIVEDTPQRIIVLSRRKIIADITFLFFVGFGGLVAYSIAQENMRDSVNVIVVFISLLFVGVGVWGLLMNAADLATLDAATRSVTIERRRMFRPVTVKIAFSDLTRIFVHENDDMHTIAFAVNGRENILLQTIYGRNPKAAPLVCRLNEWFDEAHARTSAT